MVVTVPGQDKGPRVAGAEPFLSESWYGWPPRCSSKEQLALARGLVAECLDSSSIPRWKTGASHTLCLTVQAHGLR